jgi:8-oxo-dGTP diphosphatase
MNFQEKPAAAPRAKQVVAALIVNESGELLICQRTRLQALPLKWEFPGGKIEPGEQPEEALARELEEELGIRANIGNELARIEHVYKNGNSVELHFFLVTSFEGEIENRIFEDVRWAKAADLPDYDFLDADLGLVRDLGSAKLSLTDSIVGTSRRA